MTSQAATRRIVAAAATTVLALVALGAHAGDERRLFIESAVENVAAGTVTLPLHQGTSQGRTVWYVLFDASDGKDAARFGINQAAKLANARGSAATQKVRVIDGVVDFPASVDFSFDHSVTPGPTGFPPDGFSVGSRGEAGYSPLIEFADGRILNAPHIAIGDLHTAVSDIAVHKLTHDKVVAIDPIRFTVTLRQTPGFSGGKGVRYVSTDASVEVAAALEESTYAPALGNAPKAGGDGTDSARASLAAFVNGQTGLANPQRQGLNSALLDGAAPLNVLAWSPNQGRYSPLWDVHPAAWSAQAIASGQNRRQTDFGQIRNLAQKGLVTGPDGGAFRPFPGDPNGAIVNCPIVSED